MEPREYKSLQKFLATERSYHLLGWSTAFDGVCTALQAVVMLVTLTYLDKLQVVQAAYGKTVAYNRNKYRVFDEAGCK